MKVNITSFTYPNTPPQDRVVRSQTPILGDDEAVSGAMALSTNMPTDSKMKHALFSQSLLLVFHLQNNNPMQYVKKN